MNNEVFESYKEMRESIADSLIGICGDEEDILPGVDYAFESISKLEPIDRLHITVLLEYMAEQMKALDYELQMMKGD